MARSACSRSSFRPARRRRCTTISRGGSSASIAGEQHETVYRRLDDGRDETRARLEVAKEQTLKPGRVLSAAFRRVDDIHYVRTTSAEPSISIHLLANDTACVWRHKFDPAAGTVTPFRSGYANAPCAEETA